MILGVLFGLSIACLVVSSVFFFYGIFLSSAGINLTGSVVGANGLVSYSLLGLVFSFIAVAFFIILLKRKEDSIW